jgi:hypothetical protein
VRSIEGIERVAHGGMTFEATACLRYQRFLEQAEPISIGFRFPQTVANHSGVTTHTISSGTPVLGSSTAGTPKTGDPPPGLK